MIISWTLMRLNLIRHYIDFLGDPWMAFFGHPPPASSASRR
mgnify:CR=1 FL=1